MMSIFSSTYRYYLAGALIMVFVFSAACETSFEPFKENNQFHYSMYGVLDLNADTQWVRVMPVRDSLFSNRSPLEAEVTLTRVSTGEEVVWEDSLFRYIGSERDTAWAWNFWTTYSLEARELYTFKAESPDGRASGATVTVPSNFPVPVIDYNENTMSGTVTGSGIDRIVVADALYYYRLPLEGGITTDQKIFRVSQFEREKVFMKANGEYDINISDIPYIAGELNLPSSQIIIDSMEVVIASGNDSWPEVQGLNELEQSLPGAISNVENGLGVVAGISSITLPFKSCTDENGELEPCPPKKRSFSKSLIEEAME